MNSAEIKRLTHLSVAGNANAKRKLSNAFKQAIKNLAEYRKKEAAARAKANANARAANELAVATVLSAGLPPLSRAQTAARNNGAKALMKIKKPW